MDKVGPNIVQKSLIVGDDEKGLFWTAHRIDAAGDDPRPRFFQHGLNEVIGERGDGRQGEDAEKIKGGVRIAVAAGDERFVPLGGGEMEHPAAGEVVYADDSEEVLTRMWNWRESDVTKITYSTSTAVLSFDCLPPTGLQEAKEAAVLMESRIKNCFPNARTEKAVLHEEHSSTLL